MTIHDHIRRYRAQGWATIRAHACSKKPLGEWRERTDEPDDFHANDNVGVRLGLPSRGLVDVDLDCAEGVKLAPHFLPATATFGRPGKPRSHWLYHCAAPLKSHKPPRTHIELRSTGLQTIFPPSIHESGEPITWTDPDAQVATIAEPTLVAAFGRLAAATVIARCWPTLAGNKHDAVLALAGALWHAGWSLDDTLDLLIPAFEADGSSEPHREAAIRDTFDDHDRNRHGWPTVCRLFGDVDAKAIERVLELVKPAQLPRLDPGTPAAEFPLTDYGNAERFVSDHGEDLRYTPGLGWLRWYGSHWAPSLVEPIELAVASARKLQAQGAEQAQPHAVKHGIKCESAGSLRSTVSLAASMSAIHVPADALDADHWVLNCPNGVVDLRTGELRPHDKAALHSKCTGVEYDPTAQAPRFVKFLSEIFAHDLALVGYTLRFLGYALTGSTREQVLQLWYGVGANGKTTLIETIRYVLGDYAQTLASNLLIERGGRRSSSEASPDVARLRGVRLAAGEETSEGQRWDESLVKQLTGGGRVVARQLYKDNIEFTPSWKLILAVNHKPEVRGTDNGIWRRIHLVPFEQRFDGPKADRELGDKLQQEGPGILRLLIEACRLWQLHGLQAPAIVMASVDAYRNDSDVVGQFLAEATESAGPETHVSKATLYRKYSQWARDGGMHPLGKIKFNARMKERGSEEGKHKGEPVWMNLKLRASFEI